jgi:hypothetical protein
MIAHPITTNIVANWEKIQELLKTYQRPTSSSWAQFQKESADIEKEEENDDDSGRTHPKISDQED